MNLKGSKKSKTINNDQELRQSEKNMNKDWAKSVKIRNGLSKFMETAIFKRLGN